MQSCTFFIRSAIELLVYSNGGALLSKRQYQMSKQAEKSKNRKHYTPEVQGEKVLIGK